MYRYSTYARYVHGTAYCCTVPTYTSTGNLRLTSLTETKARDFRPLVFYELTSFGDLIHSQIFF